MATPPRRSSGPRTIAAFTADLSKFGRALEGRLDELTQATGFRLAELVVDRTPVDTGNARAHWWPTIGDTPTNPPLAPDAVVESRGTPDLSALASAKAGDVVTIANNAAYIQRLENGYSQQAPQGMVAVTVAEGPAIVDEIARALTGGGRAA